MGLLRKWHRWISILVTVPFSITVVTGIILATRGFNTWVQPASVDLPRISNDQALGISFAEILQLTKQVAEAEINSWKDVAQIDIRPDKANIRVRSRVTNWEIQIDGVNKKIVHHGPRRFAWLVAMHEGAYFGKHVRYGVFFPSAIGMFLLLISGVYLYFVYYKSRLKRKRL